MAPKLWSQRSLGSIAIASASVHSIELSGSLHSAMADQSSSMSSSGVRMPPPFNPAAGAAQQQQKKKLKAPAVLIAHYTAKGMDERAASQRVIEDLQKALAFSFESYPTQKVMMMDKLVKSNVESFNQRLSQIEAKVTTTTTSANLFSYFILALELVHERISNMR